ncbi:MAG: hypothetical protein ACRET2_12465 [Steroidobacteraceae bacterium]
MGSQETSSRTRGLIIKVPDATPGILLANGQQMQFTLERVWKSPVAPAPNMTVDVEMDAAGVIRGLVVVDAQQLAKERLNQFSSVAQVHGKDAAKIAQQGIGALAERMGAVALGAAVVVLIAMFFISAAGISEGDMNVSWTFWNLLGTNFNDPQSIMGGSAASSFGFLKLLALLAMAAPFAAPFIEAIWSRYLNAAPLAIVVLGFLITWTGEHKSMAMAAQAGAPNPFSWRWGLYLLVLAALVLGAQALKTQALRSPSRA